MATTTNSGKMTPREYKKRLRELKKAARWINRDIDEALYEINRRIITGYDINETSRKLAVDRAFDRVTELQRSLASLSVAEIDYPTIK